MIAQQRPRIYWFEPAKKWAIRAEPLRDTRKAEMFVTALRQCGAVFNELMRVWIVADAHLAGARQVVTRYYGSFEFIERAPPQQEPPPPPRSKSHSAAYDTFCRLVGWVGPHLSYRRARALYRHAAARLHPDVGGSADDMAALNVAWLAVKDRLG
jgi:hypothetical protein